MKHILIISCLFAFQTYSQEQGITDNRLVVYGEGTVESAADRAQMSFTVVGFGPSIQEAMVSARAKLNAISTSLFSIGLSANDLLTSNFYSGDNPQGKAFLSSSKDFRTNMDVLVSIDNLALVDSIITVLAASPAERLSNIRFILKNDSTMKLEARKVAVADAQKKAQTIANQLSIGLGKVLYLEELFGLPRTSPANESYFISRSTTSALRIDAPGIAFSGAQRFSVTSFVKLIFEIK